MPRAIIYQEFGDLKLVTDLAGRVQDVAELLILLEHAKPPVIEQTIEVVIDTGPNLDAFVPGAMDTNGDWNLLYIKDNSHVPAGRVSSTARKGRKWFDQVEVGDRVNLVITETGDKFGEAVVVLKELLPLDVVLGNADHNHVGNVARRTGLPAEDVLADQLRAAYGQLHLDDEFSVLHILPVNQSLDD